MSLRRYRVTYQETERGPWLVCLTLVRHAENGFDEAWRALGLWFRAVGGEYVAAQVADIGPA